MSGPFPSSVTDSSAHGDDLAAVVVRRLEKRSVESWGLVKTLLLAVPSFGLIPLLVWPARFRDYATDESQAMQELAQWAKLRGRQPAAVGPLLAAAEGTAGNPLAFVLSLIVAAVVVGVYAIQFAHMPFSLDNLVSQTYSADSLLPGAPSLWQRQFVYRVWVIALSLGYGVQWLHVRAHASDVKRFVERFNPIVQAEGLPAISLSHRGWAYFRAIWIWAAVILSVYGAWWGIPMVLAGMAQKRYTHLTGRRIRTELAKRVKDIVMLRQFPAMIEPTIAAHCVNPRCMAPLKAGARFCARCGNSAQQVGHA